MSSDLVLVTGGTGFLGRCIVAALRESGRSLRLMARDPSKAEDLVADGVEVVRGDVTDRASVERAAEGCATAIHAAATVTSWEKDSTTFDRTNVQGLRYVAEAARDAGAGRVVIVSSFFALGPSNGSPVDESTEISSERDFCNDYERTKTLGELESRALVAEGHNIVTVYPGVLYGPGPEREANFVAGLLVEAAAGRLKGLPGGGDRRWSFTSVMDCARGIVLCLDKAATGARYVLGGENATLRAFFDLVEERGGPTVPQRSLPWSVLSAAGGASELLARFGGPRPKITRGAVDIFRRSWACDSSLAERELGWRSAPMSEVVPTVLDDLRSKGRLR
ncbi:MAG: NAD-dependent epimerase/dehydratase family protein [Planctomycetota bacterium]|jgi:farnesol dehydrogenase